MNLSLSSPLFLSLSTCPSRFNNRLPFVDIIHYRHPISRLLTFSTGLTLQASFVVKLKLVRSLITRLRSSPFSFTPRNIHSRFIDCKRDIPIPRGERTNNHDSKGIRSKRSVFWTKREKERMFWENLERQGERLWSFRFLRFKRANERVTKPRDKWCILRIEETLIKL